MAIVDKIVPLIISFNFHDSGIEDVSIKGLSNSLSKDSHKPWSVGCLGNVWYWSPDQGYSWPGCKGARGPARELVVWLR